MKDNSVIAKQLFSLSGRRLKALIPVSAQPYPQLASTVNVTSKGIS